MTGALAALLDTGFRHPASCLIQVGDALADLGELAPLVASVDVTTARDEAATGSIVIEDRRKEDGTWMAADSGLFARWTPIRISADFQTHLEEVFRGFIVQMWPSYPNNAGEATLELFLQDESAVLDREQMRKVWGDDAPVSDLTILTELVGSAGLSPDPASGQGQSSRSLSQDATPIQFLRERAMANGYELIFAEGTVYFGAMRLEGEPQPPIKIYAGSATNCVSFEVDDDGQRPDAVRFDLAPRDSGSTPVSETVEPDLPVLGQTPTRAEGEGLGTPSVWRLTREGDETEEEMRARAQAFANEHSFKQRASGELDGSLYGHVLHAGKLVSVDGAGTRYGGLYYVDRVVHAFSPGGFSQRFELMRNGVGETSAPGASLLSAASAIASLFG